MHRWVEHTGELELELESAGEDEVFSDALAALGELLSERTEATGEPATHRVRATGVDRATLLAEWLNELVYLAESRDFVPEAVERLELAGDSLEATVVGRRGSPPHLIKAVTYHRLGMWEEDGGWRARVVLDV
jgi:SHS2 domain-containing protein